MAGYRNTRSSGAGGRIAQLQAHDNEDADADEEVDRYHDNDS